MRQELQNFPTIQTNIDSKLSQLRPTSLEWMRKFKAATFFIYLYLLLYLTKTNKYQLANVFGRNLFISRIPSFQTVY